MIGRDSVLIWNFIAMCVNALIKIETPLPFSLETAWCR
jgi:hypothetical protein